MSPPCCEHPDGEAACPNHGARGRAPDLERELKSALGPELGGRAWRVVARALPLILARSRELEARNAELEHLGTNLDELRAGAARDLRRLAANPRGARRRRHARTRRALGMTVYDRRPCHDSGMAVRHDTRRLFAGRHVRRGAGAPAAIPAATRADLGLTEPDLEAVLLAVDDRLDLETDADARARLGRARAALELELGRLLAR